MRYSTLPYYIGSLLEDFAQPNVDVVFWGASVVSQMVKNMPAVRETWVWSLGWEDPLEKGVATHSSILACEIPWIEEPGKLQSVGSQRVEHNWATNKHTHTHKHSVLSMFKVGKPMLWYRFISLNAFSAYEGFIKRWCHHKLRWICMCIHTCLCINVLVNFFSQSVCVDIYFFYRSLFTIHMKFWNLHSHRYWTSFWSINILPQI